MASFAKQPSLAQKWFLRSSWCPSCCALGFCPGSGYRKEDPLFSRSQSVWLHLPPVQGPTWSSRSQACPERTCEGGGPSVRQGWAPDPQPERAPGERQGGAVRTRRGALGPQDLDSWVPAREGGGRGHSRRLRVQRYKSSSAKMARGIVWRSQRLGTCGSSTTPIDAAGTTTPHQLLPSPYPSASEKEEKPRCTEVQGLIINRRPLTLCPLPQRAAPQG